MVLSSIISARFEHGRELNEVEILDKAYSRKQKRYMNSKIFDLTPHTNVIKKIMYNSVNDQIILLEQGTKKLKYYSMNCHVDDSFSIEIKERFDKTFVLDFFFEPSLLIIGIVLSNRQIHFYESGFNHKILLCHESDILQTNIWYLPEHLVWVTSGVDYNMRFWKIADGKLELFQMFTAHMKEITCVLDINAPKLIASSSLDGRIKLWEFYDKALINELKDPSFSNRGIKGLCYSYEFGGLLLSYGFENYINVWCPEVSLSRPHVGKLEGHSSIVIHCKFLQGSPNAISIDEKSNIRVWDVRSLASIQVIAAEKFSFILISEELL